MRDCMPLPVGRVRLHHVDRIGCALPRGVLFKHRPQGWTQITQWRSNLVLYEWASITANLLNGNVQYKIGGMYIEFENEADPSDVVSPPDLSRDADQGVAYYNALSTSMNRDYLRVPLIASTIDSSNTTNFPGGNMPTYFAQTSGVSGVFGKPFSDTNNSRVFGGALVATPVWSDATQDLVFSRFYFDSGDQQVKLPTSQIGFEWQLILQ